MEKWGPKARERWWNLRQAWENYNFGGVIPDGLPVVNGKHHWKCGYCRYGLRKKSDGQYICPEQAAALGAVKEEANGNGVH
mgnify:CR=1 FL=1